VCGAAGAPARRAPTVDGLWTTRTGSGDSVDGRH
jgi:hypothetical protein